MEPETNGRGRPRRPETAQRIRETALELMREKGPEAVTMAAVSDRSGVAKTTIYRRYDNRGELLRDVLEQVTERGGPPPDLSPQEKLRWLLEQVEFVLGEGLGRGGVAAVLTGADPEFSAALRTSLTSALEPLQQRIAEDIADGLLKAGVEPEVLVNLCLGAYLGELLRHDELRPGWAERTAAVLAAVVASG